ncbi:MAG TPA: bifunctional acetate--CoA ligase family protein/GNAT family N-acetyltransferase [Phenylobacterium sp.]|jgi:acetyltransferase
MTVRNLDALFHPAAIALVGASNRPGAVGQVLAKNLLESGFAGPVMPVNPHDGAVRSALAYDSVTHLPCAPDLAVIATPAPSVPGLIAELGARGCRAAVVISAGFEGADGAALRQAALDAAQPHVLRIVGPNCLGVICPASGVNASFAHLTPAAGGLALVSQSGAIAAAALDWAHGRGLGFSKIVTIGDALDVDVGDLLDYLALDFDTKAILLYVESVTAARKFMSAARIAARAKPVIVLKAGRSSAGAKAAFSHTGALAGADAVYDAAFRRAGLLRVFELREVFEAAETLGAGLSAAGDRLAILTNGGGAGVLAVDALDARSGQLAELSPATLEALGGIAPRNWSKRNPVDILGDAPAGLYESSLAILAAAPEVDVVLVMNCPVAVTDSTDAARAVLRAAPRGVRRKPVVTCWLGGTAVAEGRRLLAAAGLPSAEAPDEAVRTVMHLVDHRRNQALLMQTPAAVTDALDAATARRIVEQALAEGRTALTDPEARALLAAYGVPVVASAVAADPAAAGTLAAGIAGPVALKILSRDISHKSDVGGVALGLAGAAAVEREAVAMLARVRAARPDATIDGFVLEAMVRRPQSQELLVGIARDPTFGPVILFGQGGTAAEVIADRCVGLPPLDDVLAHDMIARTRVARLLAAYRDRPPADQGAIARTLIALGQIAVDLPEVRELDINPLLADAGGVLALDARVGLAAADPAGPAILPYPAHLTSRTTVAGEALVVRPVRPQDAPALIAMIERSDPSDVRFRFGGAMRRLSPQLAAQLSQIDYDRQMAFVAERKDGAIIGVARLVADPQGETAEFALMVESDRQNRGLGRLLMKRLLDYAEARGLRRVWGQVARANDRMLQLCAAFGFARSADGDPATVRLTKAMAAQAVAPADG